MAEEVVLKLTIDDKEFDVKIAADSKAIEALRKQFEKTSTGSSNSISGLKKNLDSLVSKFEDAEIGSEEFKKLKTEVDKTRTAIQKAEKNIGDLEEPSKSVLDVFSQWGNIVTGLNQALEVAQKLYSVISKPINVAGEFERYEVQFEVLLGGIRETKERINELSVFAAKTPFEFPEIIRASKQLEVMTKGALATGEGLRMIGDVSSGVGVPIDELSMWFGRLYDSIQSGRPAGEAMMRLQELGAMSGEARGEIEDLMKTNKDANDVWKAVTNEMGRFDGMMQKQSETYEGMVSNLDDSITLLNRAIGNILLPMAKNLLDSIIPAVETFTKLFESAAENARRAFEGQDAVVKKLDEAMPSLLDSYDSLAEKSSLNKDEQEKLQTVMNDIATMLPTAVTQWDSYGNAIGIARDKVIDLMNVEKARLTYLNKDAIAEYEKEIQIVSTKRANLVNELNSGFKESYLNTPDGKVMTVKLKLGPEDIRKSREEIINLTSDITGMNAELSRLRGDDILIPDEVESVTKKVTNAQIKSELELYNLKHDLNEISDEEYKQYLENRIVNLKSGTAEEKKVLLAYKKELEDLDKSTTKEKFDKSKDELELTKLQKDLLQISLEDYKVYLEERIVSLKSGTAEEKKILLQYQKELISTNKEIDKKDKVEAKDEGQFNNLEADATVDKYKREEKLLDIWKDKELKKWADNEKAKANIEQIYSRKREEIAIAERDAKIAIVMDTLGTMASMFGEHTAAYKALAVAQSIWNTYQAATAALSAQPFGPWNYVNAIAVTAAGLKNVDEIISYEAPKTPGLAKGGRLKKGDQGFIEGWHNEIVAPEDTFVEIFKNELRPKIYSNYENMSAHPADLINKAVSAVEHKMMAINIQNSSGDNLLLVAKFDEYNDNLKKYLENPVAPIITKDAVGKVYRDGRKYSKGYRG